MHAFLRSTVVVALSYIIGQGLFTQAYIDGLQTELSQLVGKESTPTVAQHRARRGFMTLQHMYYSRTGLWRTCGWWNSANALTTVANMAKNDPGNEDVQYVAQRIFSEAIVRAPKRNPQPGAEDPNSGKNDPSTYSKSMGPNGEYITTYPKDWWEGLGEGVEDNRTEADVQEGVFNVPNAGDWLDGYYDDDLWWALAWISAYDVTSDERYLHLAEGIFAAVAKTWPTHCFDGGIYWSVDADYVNAIANELFFSTAAHLANRAKKKAYYTQWAEETLTWFIRSSMINDEGTINDGLDKNCKNNGRNTWSYNQGVILGGLVELQTALPHPSNPYLSLAAQIAHAALSALSGAKGIIHDICEPDCGADGTQFKGIFMRNLGLLQEVAPDAIFADAVQRNAESIWEWDRAADGETVFSVVWSGPYVWPGNASTHSSAMDALVAAMMVERNVDWGRGGEGEGEEQMEL